MNLASFTVHSVLFTVYILQCEVYIAHLTSVYSLPAKFYSVQFIVYSLQCTIYSVYLTVYILHCTIYWGYFTVNSVKCTVNSVQCTVTYFINVTNITNFIHENFQNLGVNRLVVTSPQVIFPCCKPNCLALKSPKTYLVFIFNSIFHMFPGYLSFQISPLFCQSVRTCHLRCYAQNKPNFLQHLFHNLPKA